MATPAEAQQAIDIFNAYSLADRALKVKAAKLREARGDAQNQLGAFFLAGRKPSVKTSKPRSPGPVQGGYQG